MLTMFGRGDSDSALDEINAKAALEQSMRRQMMARPTESCLHVVQTLGLLVSGSPSYSWQGKQKTIATSTGSDVGGGEDNMEALAVLNLEDEEDDDEEEEDEGTEKSPKSDSTTGAGEGSSNAASPASNVCGANNVYVHNSTGLMPLARPPGLLYVCTPIDAAIVASAKRAKADTAGSAAETEEASKEKDTEEAKITSESANSASASTEDKEDQESSLPSTTGSVPITVSDFSTQDSLASALAARLTKFHRNSIPVVCVYLSRKFWKISIILYDVCSVVFDIDISLMTTNPCTQTP